MILQTVAPDDRILEAAFHGGIYTFVGKLVVSIQSIAAYPDATTTAHHKARAIGTASKGEVRQAFDNLTVAGIELEPAVGPHEAAFVLGKVIAIDDIHNDATIVKAVSLGVVSLTYRVHNAERTDGIVASGVKHGGVAPKHMALGRQLGPATHVEVIDAIRGL